MTLTTIFAYDPLDTDEIRVEKFAIFLIAGSCCVAGSIWSLMYFAIFGWGLIAFLPLLFVILVGSALIASHLSKNHYVAVYVQIICIMYITAFIQWSIGGIFDSGFVMAWAIVGPIVALMFFSVKKSILWLGLFLVNLVITVVFNGYFVRHAQPVSENISLMFFLMNLGAPSIAIFVFASYFVTQAINERERANGLLLNMLPRQIATILKSGPQTIANHHEEVTVLIVDIVGSTPLFTELTPKEAVEWLNEIFSNFDSLVERHGLEKIGTVGDGYTVAAGVPAARSDHAYAICELALDMIQIHQTLPAEIGKRISFRMGINSGPLVAGVIGTKKPQYNVWGDTVNTASRMESHGEAGKIQLSPATYALIKDDFECLSRGTISVKGKGDMDTWFLVCKSSSRS